MQIELDPRTQELLDLLRQPFLRAHFSQLGEDCVLWHYFQEKFNGFYVDVGAHHPYRYSNTALLHRARHWKGINIDADQRAIAAFLTSRPNDVNLCVGVGSVEETRSFAVFNDGAVNTFDSATAQRNSSNFGTGRTEQIAIRRLENILNDHLPANTPIDYLNVDCEGLDHDVITSNNWTRFRPQIVSVEIHGLNLETPLHHPTVKFMKDQGYKLRSYYYATVFFERT